MRETLDDFSDREQYASAAIALAWQLRRANSARVAGRIAAVKAAFADAQTRATQGEDGYLVPCAAWHCLAEVIATLPDEV